MLRRITPAGMAPPAANYSHASLVPPGAHWLHLSGQLGTRPDGSVADGFEAQAIACFENVGTILRAADMDFTDLVRLNTFLTDGGHLAAYMAVRDRFVGDPPPASTLVVVAALARPEFVIEVEAIAARLK